MDSLTILQGMGTWHRRTTTSKTTSLPIQAEYAREEPFVSSVIVAVTTLGRIRLSAGINTYLL